LAVSGDNGYLGFGPITIYGYQARTYIDCKGKGSGGEWFGATSKEMSAGGPNAKGQWAISWEFYGPYDNYSACSPQQCPGNPGQKRELMADGNWYGG
jgi:hypothetical protein